MRFAPAAISAYKLSLLLSQERVMKRGCRQRAFIFSVLLLSYQEVGTILCYAVIRSTWYRQCAVVYTFLVLLLRGSVL